MQSKQVKGSQKTNAVKAGKWIRHRKQMQLKQENGTQKTNAVEAGKWNTVSKCSRGRK
jgi:hypothetical protein